VFAVTCVVELTRVAARRARGGDAERRNPQERAIDGPAEYPTNAPATAPMGPRTTAPDKAPSAASPTRSPALAWYEIKDPAIRVPTNSFFIAISPNMSRG